MMNADLADVSKKGENTQSIAAAPRKRSTSNNSRDGSNLKPDPNRYKKYLSLRNRKIVENQHRHYEESAASSQHTES